ncbi:MAG: hypothetical protein ACTSVI_16155 [Promethearchaeota archaeon]
MGILTSLFLVLNVLVIFNSISSLAPSSSSNVQSGEILNANLASSGQEIWIKNVSFGVSNSSDEFEGAVHENGYIYAFGSINETNPYPDALLVKYSENGDFIWKSSIGHPYSQVSTDIVIIGDFIYWEGITSEHDGVSIDFFVQKVNKTDGTVIWRYIVDTPADIEFLNIIDTNNSYTLVFKQDTYGSTPGLIFILKYSLDGTLLSNNSFAVGSIAFKNMVYHENKFYFAGKNMSDNSLYISSYYPNGTAIWVKT